MKRAVGYCRQSVGRPGETEEDALSLDAQEHEIRDWCQRNDHALVRVFRDRDVSGALDEHDRPGLSALKAWLPDNAIDTAVCWRLSRLARDLLIQERFIKEIASLGVGYASAIPSEAWASNNTFIRQIFGAFAQEQRAQIAAHVRSALATRARRGLTHGRPPYGYVRVEPGGPLAIDPPRAAVVVELYERYAAGESVTVISDALTVRGTPTPLGVPRWDRSTITNILSNPVYRGAVTSGGREHPGQHPAIVADELWHRVAERRAEETRAVRRKPASSWLEGLIRHGCGRPMHLICNTASGQRPFFRCASQALKPALRCTVRPRQVVAEDAEQVVRDRLATDLAALAPIASVLRAMEREHRDREPLAERRRRELADRLSRAEARRSKAEDLYLSGSRDRAWFDSQDATIAAEVSGAKAALSALPSPPDPVAVRETYAALKSAATQIGTMTDADLRALLASVGHAISDADGVRIEYRAEVAAMLGRRTLAG